MEFEVLDGIGLDERFPANITTFRSSRGRCFRRCYYDLMSRTSGSGVFIQCTRWLCGNSTHSIWMTSSSTSSARRIRLSSTKQHSATIRCNMRVIVNAHTFRRRCTDRRTLCRILNVGKCLISWLCTPVSEKRERTRMRGKSLVTCLCPCNVCPFQTGLVHESIAQNVIRLAGGKFSLCSMNSLFAFVF